LIYALKRIFIYPKLYIMVIRSYHVQ